MEGSGITTASTSSTTTGSKSSKQANIKTSKKISASFIHDLSESDNIKLFSKVNKDPLNLSVSNLSYNVPAPGSAFKHALPSCLKPGNLPEQEILKQVSFSVNPGRFLAIMGGSGSGKTSLLDAITGYTSSGRVIGSNPVTVGGLPISENIHRRYVGYVTQDDRLLPNLTVRETLMYVALLRLPSHLSRAEKMDRVDAVVGELGLSHVANSKIGGFAFKGISGGERRRVSIATQMVIDPSILLLDEPTTGLDAFTAYSIVSTLRTIAQNSNRTVICTIHQPRSEVFEIFDLMLLLSKGEVCYFGDKDRIIPYFESIGYKCPSFVNPTEYFLDLTTVDYRDEEKEKATSAVIERLIEAYRATLAKDSSSFFLKPDERENGLHVVPPNSQHGPTGVPLSLDMVNEKFKKPIGRWEQFTLLYMRATRNEIHDLGGFAVHCAESLMMALVCGIIFFDLGSDQNSIRDRMGLFFVACSLYCFILILGFIVKFDEHRPTFFRERRDACYDLLPYFASQFFSELPFVCVTVILYSMPIFYMAGLNPNNGGFGMFLVIILLVVYVSRSYALLASSLFANMKFAVFFANLVFSFFVFSGGFIVNLDSIVPAVRWISYFSYQRRGIEACAINEFPGLTFQCGSTSLDECITTGDQALDVYNLGSDSLAVNLLVLLANIVACRIVAFACLRFIDQRPVQ